MSNSTRIVLVLAMLAAVAGCAKKQETVVEPITVEPTETGTYK